MNSRQCGFKPGQLVCVLLRNRSGDADQWRFGRIKVICVRLKKEEVPTAEVSTYAVAKYRDMSVSEEAWEWLYPSVSVTPEWIMLQRLAARLLPDERTPVDKTVIIPLRDICPAQYGRFLKYLTEGRDFSLVRKMPW